MDNGSSTEGERGSRPSTFNNSVQGKSTFYNYSASANPNCKIPGMYLSIVTGASSTGHSSKYNHPVPELLPGTGIKKRPSGPWTTVVTVDVEFSEPLASARLSKLPSGCSELSSSAVPNNKTNTFLNYSCL